MCDFNIKIIVFTLLICFLNNHNALAQTCESPAFRNIDQENGLSDNNVQCIYKDRNGFMWIRPRPGL